MEERITDKHHIAMKIVLMVVILVFPLLAGQIISVLLFYSLVALICSFLILGILGIGELIVGVAMIGLGFEKLFSMPMGAVSVMGFGIVNIGLALLLECFVLWMYGVILPGLFRKIRNRGKKDEKTS